MSDSPRLFDQIDREIEIQLSRAAAANSAWQFKRTGSGELRIEGPSGEWVTFYIVLPKNLKKSEQAGLRWQITFEHRPGGRLGGVIREVNASHWPILGEIRTGQNLQTAVAGILAPYLKKRGIIR